MTAVDDLYRRIVLEHGRRPRNRGALTHPTHAADGDNPLCGDALRVEVAVTGDVVTGLGFSGESCVIATASASLMTERLRGATRSEVERLIATMEELCTRGAGCDDGLGDLTAFADVHRYPVRVACALLAWRTLHAALVVV